MAIGWVVALLGLMLVLALNGLAAGVAAIFHAWRVRLPRESRVFFASVAAAVLPAGVIVLLAIVGASQPGTRATLGPMEFLLIFGACTVAGIIVSLPGAVVVARKLESPGEDYRTFE